MNILAVESSCDETAVAIVRDGREVLTDCIASQVDLHRLYGGVVPEIASRPWPIQASAGPTSMPWPLPMPRGSSEPCWWGSTSPRLRPSL